MNLRSTSGFSLIELMVAIVILASGLLLLAGGSLAVTRDLGRGRMSTVAAGMADEKIDQLRAVAASTTTSCTAAAFAGSGSPTTANGVTMSWTINPTSGAVRTIRVITSFKAARGRTVADTTWGIVAC